MSKTNEAHNKGQEDGSQDKGYRNPAHDIASEIWSSGKETQETSKAYSDGYKHGQSNKSN
jgi:hypothetical protein